MPNNSDHFTLFSRTNALRAAALIFALASFGAVADTLDASVNGEIKIANHHKRSQQTINGLADQTEDLLQDYRQVVAETNSLRKYNDQMQEIVNSQEREKKSLQKQIDGLEKTNRDVVPFMLEMVDMYGKLVAGDIPFLLAERQDRIDHLQDLMDRADVTISEKFRRITEAYTIELDYGRSTSAYRAALPGTDKIVDFLKIGRVSLLYRTLDGKEVGWYHPQHRKFERLPDRYRLAVDKGIKIAKKRVAPDLIRLPVIAPEEASK